VTAPLDRELEVASLSGEVEAVMRGIVTRLMEFDGADGASLSTIDDEFAYFKVCEGADVQLQDQTLPLVATLGNECVLRGDIAVLRATTGPEVARCLTPGAGAIILAPIGYDGAIRGILGVRSTDVAAFDDNDVETLRVLARAASIALRNAELVEELRESEARFRGAFHSSSLGMALSTLDGDFVQVNDKLAAMLGYTINELSSLGVHGITHPDDIDVDLERLKHLRSGQIDSFRREKRYVRSDGSVVWAELTVSRVARDDGKPTHVVSHVQDITAQKEANLLFEATFERSVVPTLIADDSRRIVGLNRSGAALLGISQDEALELTVDELLPDQPVAELWSAFMKIGAREAEVRLKRPDESVRLIEFTATANIRPGRHIAVIRDLTRQRELEVQLRQAQKMEAVGRLAGGIAHDFNNLLTAIAGYSEFLIEGEIDPRQRRHAEEIKKAAARAAALTGQLLAFSRRQVLQPRVLDLNAVVSDMDMMLRRLIGEDIELATMLDPSLGAIRADPTQLEQVIVNLAVNARDAMPGGGSVTIETANVVAERGSMIELRLTDTGAGMTDAERHQLFDPFFTTKAGGTGLGLATVYGIVEQSGGTIEVTSAPGLGSSFRVLFPLVDERAQEPAPATVAAAPRNGDETVLLVEDEPVVRQLVAEILETNGYTVLQAADGPSVLELARRHSGEISLLVTDVVMPGMSGPEVAQSVTAMRPGTLVLYMSGYTDSAIGHHGVLEPGIAFLQKPFSTDDLMRKVRALLDETAVAID
jgi:PAS domain S-box-containing protein